MHHLICTFAVVSSIILQGPTVTPVHPGRGGSPHVRVERTVHGAALSVEYGRPYLKGRELSALAPVGRVWRTGADEATTFTTSAPLQFGTVAVPAGRYTLYTIPGASEWQLIINTQTGQWGTAYNEARDLARVPMKVERLQASVEQFTISIDESADGGVLRIEWGNVSARAPFRVTASPQR